LLEAIFFIPPCRSARMDGNELRVLRIKGIVRIPGSLAVLTNRSGASGLRLLDLQSKANIYFHYIY